MCVGVDSRRSIVDSSLAEYDWPFSPIIGCGADAALQPHLENLSKLEGALDELHTLAKTLDTRSRELGALRPTMPIPPPRMH